MFQKRHTAHVLHYQLVTQCQSHLLLHSMSQGRLLESHFPQALSVVRACQWLSALAQGLTAVFSSVRISVQWAATGLSRQVPVRHLLWSCWLVMFTLQLGDCRATSSQDQPWELLTPAPQPFRVIQFNLSELNKRQSCFCVPAQALTVEAIGIERSLRGTGTCKHLLPLSLLAHLTYCSLTSQCPPCVYCLAQT